MANAGQTRLFVVESGNNIVSLSFLGEDHLGNNIRHFGHDLQ